jgi:hypothetical protein
MPRADASRQHCAIYTRKSSEEGLEQEFNSLAAQREACEAFICDQRNEGWVLVRTRYDDGGFSASKLPTSQTEAKGGKQSAYFVVELEITQPDRDGALPGGGPRHDHAIWRPLPDRGGGTELVEGGPEPKRIVILQFPDAAAVQALVQLARIPENPAGPARQLDRPRLCRRRR